MRSILRIIVMLMVASVAGSVSAKPRPPVKASLGKPILEPGLSAARKRIVARRSVPYASLQGLADSGDSLGAFKLAQSLEDRNRPEILTDALHYYAMSSTLGRNYAVWPMIRILSREDIFIRPTHLEQAQKALLQQAARGNADALNAMVRFYQLGKPFGAKLIEAEALLRSRGGKIDGAAAYKLAMLLINGEKRDSKTRVEALKYLNIAKDSDNVGIRASAINLIEMMSKVVKKVENEG